MKKQRVTLKCVFCGMTPPGHRLYICGKRDVCQVCMLNQEKTAFCRSCVKSENEYVERTHLCHECGECISNHCEHEKAREILGEEATKDLDILHKKYGRIPLPHERDTTSRTFDLTEHIWRDNNAFNTLEYYEKEKDIILDGHAKLVSFLEDYLAFTKKYKDIFGRHYLNPGN